MGKLGRYGHHPDDPIDAQVEIDRLEGLLTERRRRWDVLLNIEP